MPRRKKVVVDQKDIIKDRPVKPVRGREPGRRRVTTIRQQPAPKPKPEEKYPWWDWANKPWGPELAPLPMEAEIKTE